MLSKAPSLCRSLGQCSWAAALLALAQVDLVLLPAVTGDFGVMPGHVPTVAQLRPGVVTVHHELDKAIEKFFVSSGFAFVHADSSTDVCAVEAVKLEDLDPEAVRAGLQVCIFRVLGPGSMRWASSFQGHVGCRGRSGRHVVSGPLYAVCPAATSSAQLCIFAERLRDPQAASHSCCGSVCLGFDPSRTGLLKNKHQQARSDVNAAWCAGLHSQAGVAAGQGRRL